MGSESRGELREHGIYVCPAAKLARREQQAGYPADGDQRDRGLERPLGLRRLALPLAKAVSP